MNFGCVWRGLPRLWKWFVVGYKENAMSGDHLIVHGVCPKLKRKLKRKALDENKTMKTLVHEMLVMYLETRGKK